MIYYQMGGQIDTLCDPNRTEFAVVFFFLEGSLCLECDTGGCERGLRPRLCRTKKQQKDVKHTCAVL